MAVIIAETPMTIVIISLRASLFLEKNETATNEAVERVIIMFKKVTNVLNKFSCP